MLHVMACCSSCRYCGEEQAVDAYEGLEAKALSLAMIYKGMEEYLRRHPKGKKFHDPLAAACALNPDIGIWAQVQMYRERGQWGCFLDQDSKVQIITGYDHELFVRTLLVG